MNLLIPLALLLAGAASHSSGRANLPPEVSEALSRALSVPGARIVPIGWAAQLPTGCTIREATLAGSVTGSARLPVRLHGQECVGWGWAQFEVRAPAAVTKRAVRAGEPLQPALRIEDREIKTGHTAFMPASGALAARDLPAGILLQPTHVAGAALASGEAVKVIVLNGSLVIETQGRAISCGASRTCAVLASGRHVEGRLENGRLVVEVP